MMVRRVEMESTRCEGRGISGGFGGITVNGATKGFPGVPPSFLRIRPSVRSQSNQDSQLFNGGRLADRPDIRRRSLFFLLPPPLLLVIHLSSSSSSSSLCFAASNVSVTFQASARFTAFHLVKRSFFSPPPSLTLDHSSVQMCLRCP